MNRNHHAFNIKNLANLIKKYWHIFPLSETDKLSSMLPTQRPHTGQAAAILENLLEDPT